MRRQLLFTERFLAEFAETLNWTRLTFGEAAEARYDRLVRRTLLRLETCDPEPSLSDHLQLPKRSVYPTSES